MRLGEYRRDRLGAPGVEVTGSLVPVTRRRATLALAAWTYAVWTVRIGNILGDDALDGAEQARAVGLALAFTVLASLALWTELTDRPRRRTAVLALAAWTVAVWAVRAPDLALGDHGAAFVVVHLVLALVSVGLSWLAVRAGTVVAGSREQTADR